MSSDSAGGKRQGLRQQWMVIAAVVVNALSLAHIQLIGTIDQPMSSILGWALIGFNLAIAVLGLLTPARLIWLGYLIVSLAGLFLLGMATPGSAAWALVMFTAV